MVFELGKSGSLSAGDLARLADIHVRSLPHSSVSYLGYAYTRTFFEFVQGSTEEALLIQREGEQIAGYCLLSFAPSTLKKRLHRDTPVLRGVVSQLHRVRIWPFLLHSLWDSFREKPSDSSFPEVVLISVDGDARGRGIGGRLMAEAEKMVASHGETQLQVRTETRSSNRALAFYHRCGYQELERLRISGSLYSVFGKDLQAAETR